MHTATTGAAPVAGFSLTRMGVQCALSQRLPRTYGSLGAASYPCVIVFGYVLPPCILIGLAAMMWDAEPFGCWVYGFGIIIGGSSMLLFFISRMYIAVS